MTTRLLLLAALTAAPAAAAPPNVILVSVDDLRADRLVSDLAPNLVAFSSRAVSFIQAYSAATWTLPSHASLLTGELPRAHGAGGDTARPRGMRDGEKTLALRFREKGYRTAGFYNGEYLDPAFGFGSGFDDYRRAYVVSTFADAARWAREHRDKPFFLFVHSYLVHRYPRLTGGTCDAADAALPYPALERGATPKRCERARSRYDLAVRCLDADLGKFLRALDADGLLAGSVVAVTSDHGEELCEERDGERVLGHGSLPYEEAIHVPWLLKLPGGRRAGERVGGPVGGADVAPTLAAAAGLPPYATDGVSRLSASTGAVVVEADDWAALREPGRTAVLFKSGRRAVFGGSEDAPEAFSLLRARLRQPASEGRRVTLDARARQSLKAAGYLP